MKKFILVLGLIYLVSLLYGQNTSVTNNNTIIIQGNIYYFQPSDMPSSPPPTVGNNNFISTGSWYGENAARAWASISDWAVEHCKKSSSAIRGSSNEKVYISQVHAYRTDSPEIIRRYFITDTHYPRKNIGDIGGIAIYYWIVRDGERMENGRRGYRYFVF